MKKALFTAVAAASLMAFGCDDKKEQHAATPETDKAADKVAGQATDAMKGVEKSVKGGASEAKDMANGNGDMKAGAETVQNNILDLTGKAKQALQEKKFDDAAGFVAQAKELKNKLPADAQAQVDMQLAEVDKLIAAGKATMGGAGK